jgi:hypothetical protein
MDVLSHSYATEPNKFIYKFLTDTGGSSDLSVNATSTAQQVFFWQNDTTTIALISRLNIQMQASGILPTDFGGISGGLANGLLISARDTNGASLMDFLDGSTIKNNAEFILLAGTDVDRETAGPGDDFLGVRWTIDKAGAKMEVKQGQSIRFTVQDDLSTITDFRVKAQGVYLPSVV